MHMGEHSIDTRVFFLQLVRLLCTFCCRFLGWAGWVMSAGDFAQFSWLIPGIDEEGRPSMDGPGLSAMYHLVWRCFE